MAKFVVVVAVEDGTAPTVANSDTVEMVAEAMVELHTQGPLLPVHMVRYSQVAEVEVEAKVAVATLAVLVVVELLLFLIHALE
jgi:hypothetical protein